MDKSIGRDHQSFDDHSVGIIGHEGLVAEEISDLGGVVHASAHEDAAGVELEGCGLAVFLHGVGVVGAVDVGDFAEPVLEGLA